MPPPKIATARSESVARAPDPRAAVAVNAAAVPRTARRETTELSMRRIYLANRISRRETSLSTG
ncbi:hypothetical protein D5S18_18890 [Nocardia panacis]|uniref:Uncharacterized protein n=1 Tax=Nocardia panacis TaxID=2340916 RepID=A0A3A4KFV7_9NOCA|nr:hypothetical protein D5S18_18890 [Nocardia panacis]